MSEKNPFPVNESIRVEFSSLDQSKRVRGILVSQEGNEVTLRLPNPEDIHQIDSNGFIEFSYEQIFYKMKVVLQKKESPLVHFVIEGNLEKEERRQFLRVDARIRISAEKIEPSDFDHYSKALYARPKMMVDEMGNSLPFLGESDDQAKWYSHLLGKVISLEEKIDMLLEISQKGVLSKKIRKEIREVNISGSGVALHSDEDFEPGSFLYIKFDLPLSTPIEVAVIGEVLRKEPKDTSARYICFFRAIKEVDRDDIVRFTYQRQRELSRNR